MTAAAVMLLALCACADLDPDDPPSPVVCSSGHANVGTSESEDMAPGRTCNDCHAYTNAGGDGLDAPLFAFAGTVYPTLHEPDDCAGAAIAPADHAQVEVVTATGKRLVAPLTRAGNFMLEAAPLDLPLTARVVYRGRVRWMIGSATSGECNTCHSAAGTDGSRGRIRLP